MRRGREWKEREKERRGEEGKEGEKMDDGEGTKQRILSQQKALTAWKRNEFIKSENWRDFERNQNNFMNFFPFLLLLPPPPGNEESDGENKKQEPIRERKTGSERLDGGGGGGGGGESKYAIKSLLFLRPINSCRQYVHSKPLMIHLNDAPDVNWSWRTSKKKKYLKVDSQQINSKPKASGYAALRFTDWFRNVQTLPVYRDNRNKFLSLPRLLNV